MVYQVATDAHVILSICMIIGGNVDHIHCRDLYSADRPSRRNGLSAGLSAAGILNPFTADPVTALRFAILA